MSLSLVSDEEYEVFSLWTSKDQIKRKISKSKNLQNFDLLGALEIRGYEKLRFLAQPVILWGRKTLLNPINPRDWWRHVTLKGAVRQ